jgi:hypothetical protein
VIVLDLSLVTLSNKLEELRNGFGCTSNLSVKNSLVEAPTRPLDIISAIGGWPLRTVKSAPCKRRNKSLRLAASASEVAFRPAFVPQPVGQIAGRCPDLLEAWFPSRRSGAGLGSALKGGPMQRELGVVLLLENVVDRRLSCQKVRSAGPLSTRPLGMS